MHNSGFNSGFNRINTNLVKGKKMGNLFSNYMPVNENEQNENANILIAYERHYHDLVRNYREEISYMEGMLEEIRKEREGFYRIKLPEIENVMKEESVLNDEAKREWIEELRRNMESSFKQSEDLVKHYITNNLNEFKEKMYEFLNK